jgi:TetR/AcrR family transcriptional regulator
VTLPITSEIAGSRNRRKQARPGEILEAALKVFVERGYANARAEDVAAAAGVSKGTVYVYFENKQALFRAVVQENIIPLIEEFGQSVENSDEPSEKTLERYFNTWWELFGSTRLAGIVRLVVAESCNFPEIAEFFAQDVIRRDSELLAKILLRGVARGEWRDVPLESICHTMMAPLILECIWSSSVKPFAKSPIDVDSKQMIRDHLAFCLTSLRKTP